ncbi:hypothetical protein [Bartonella tribocorum]|uniref:Uncharacterized protein n=1 Tax=Bartonella tribocorum (strain DSM 28219 / CCUG 45778 / CIP 105476 / IBS 506) TaxID=382640 RepID=A9IVX8_BART1|nr:hypothetical protein [Bartonella tribocorum]CAK01827.1 hypothetical protein BT_1478 [Bartonella tribocorum CIP 105476]CDO49076.1 hypothetical membrane protein [Bartonella tribocorum]
MKIFKHCIVCLVATAIFFSQVLGANANSLNGRFQNDDFISGMTQENGVTKAVNMIINQLGGQSDEKNVQKVAALMGMEAAIFGLIAYLVYFFSRKPPSPKRSSGGRIFDALAYSAWAFN